MMTERFQRTKTTAHRLQLISKLTQKHGEEVDAFYDRVALALIKVHETNRVTLAAEGDKLAGYNTAVDSTQAMMFIAGLRADIRTYIEDKLEENSTLTDIRKWAIKAESIYVSNKNLVAEVNVSQAPQQDGAGGGDNERRQQTARRGDQLRSAELQLAEVRLELAAVKGSYKSTGAKPKGGQRGGRSGAGAGTPMPPMAQRDRWLFCYNCRQFGKHLARECKLSREEARRKFPTSMDQKKPPQGTPYDDQFLC
jgi:hypothetical protein